jgi:hypothetical protein
MAQDTAHGDKSTKRENKAAENTRTKENVVRREAAEDGSKAEA